jgi:hypothetical protein
VSFGSHRKYGVRSGVFYRSGNSIGPVGCNLSCHGGHVLIAERYHLDERIGSGGMGEVWRATDRELGRTVAVKRSHDGNGGHIRREGRIAAGLAHPNVIMVFDSVLHDGTKWLVMEYLPARSLAEIIRTDGPLAPETAAVIGAQIAAALVAMHDRRMVHRDVTPANVLVAPGNVAKLTDFGISHWDEVTVTGGDRVLGTPAYLAPEVAAGRDARRQADVFSLGATLYAAVEGHSPWGPRSLDPDTMLRRARDGERLPAVRAGALTPVLDDLLQREPEARPSAAAAKVLLDEVGGVTVPVVPLPPEPPADVTVDVEKTTAPQQRRRGLLVGAGVLVVALAAGVIADLAKDDPLTGSPRPAVPVGAGAVLDPHTADPCAVLDRASLTDFGTGAVLVDSEYGYFNQCGLSVRFTDKNEDVGVVGLFIERLPDYLKGSHSATELGSILGAKEDENGRCERLIPLPGNNMVRISAELQGARLADPCDMAQAVAVSAHALLEQGPIRRRSGPFPEDSLGRQDACELLSDAEVRLALERDYEVQPELGRWHCYFAAAGDDPQIEIEFSKEWLEEIDNPIRIGDRAGKESRNDDSCDIEFQVRRYTNPADTNPTHEWVELARVSLEDSSGDMDTLCDKATVLAGAVEKRLP